MAYWHRLCAVLDQLNSARLSSAQLTLPVPAIPGACAIHPRRTYLHPLAAPIPSTAWTRARRPPTTGDQGCQSDALSHSALGAARGVYGSDTQALPRHACCTPHQPMPYAIQHCCLLASCRGTAPKRIDTYHSELIIFIQVLRGAQLQLLQPQGASQRILPVWHDRPLHTG